ncbi:winged helix-turn-helix domain-containing protein [Terracidiphilus gabretensis]|uniref:winged helix-turn-helix domain-containing protein n=1 Tax=Terracidiphilus gabretensis TaxID=1577687 RepID=UPI00071BEDB9|nr:winged helix-turn-helix domain-containing protein [Terracidiphilus gabretensis]
MSVSPTENVIRFGLFELELKSGQLRKNGSRIRIPRQPAQVLALLLERPGEVVTREELRQRLWSPDTFIDFDHALNKSVQKLRDALGDSAESPRFIETIPRVGYRFIAPVKENARRVIEELDEQTGDELPAEPASDKNTLILPTEPRTKTGWLLVAGCMAALLMGAGWLAYTKHEREQQIAPVHSLAVLPLDNLSGDHEQDYFADGMTDELTTMLAKDSTLRIVSRTSAMQYRRATRPLPEIAQALGVDGVVEGSVERSGDKVHMTLQLIQGSSDAHVWAESYDRDANNTVSLLNEAAMAIAKKTNSAVAERPPARYVNPEAHDAYMRGEHLWYSENNSDKAKDYFQRAVELEPDYALGWLGLSQYYGSNLLNGRMNPMEGLVPMEAAAQKAVELDGSLPDPHIALCGSIFFKEHDWARADRECMRAIDLDPRYASAYRMRARLFGAVNRHDEGIAQEKIATELDPSGDQWGLARSYLWARKYDLGIADARLRLESSPHNAKTLENLAALYRCKGMYEEAAQAWEDMFSARGDEVSASSVRRAFAEGGYTAVVRWNLADLKKQSLQHYVSPVLLALAHAQLQQREETLNSLEEAYRSRDPLLLWVQDDPAYDFVHSDERYRSVIKGMGLQPAY